MGAEKDKEKDKDKEGGKDKELSKEEKQREKERERLKWLHLAPIAKPLASKKLNKKALKIVKRAAKTKQLKRGVREVVKALRKGQKGVCILAGDISPIDSITHVPILCEENDVPYVYVPSKEDLGTAGAVKRPTSCMLIMPEPLKGDWGSEDPAKYKAEYEDIAKDCRELYDSTF
eukprot:SM000027S09578  [mRNA]  locus=s27:124229:125217:+ [translate_table: standard]